MVLPVRRSEERDRELSEDLCEIGFNSDADSGQRRLHVQTEVIGGTEPKIRTMVLDCGKVQHVESHAYPSDAQDAKIVRAMAEAQHHDVLAKVTSGMLG